MSCGTVVPHPNEGFFQRFRNNAVTNRVPVSGAVELTRMCNFRCLHCYHGGISTPRSELTTQEWFRILDQLTEAGTLFLLITGGEPLLRKDFPEIYTYAVKKGLIVSLFTNGFLLTDELIGLFRKFPPRVIEISIYGASSSVYEKVTRVEAAHQRCLDNIIKLKDNNIRTQLKSVFIRENIEDFDAIRSLAEELGLPFRFDTAVTPALQGDKAPLEHRLTPEQAVRLNLSSEELRMQWRNKAEELQNIQVSERLYSCGAALTSYYIDAHGWLYPCMMTTDIRYSLAKGVFQTGWLEELPKIWEKKIDPNNRCDSCKNRMFCDYCPATFQLETGSENIASDYLCQVGSLTSRQLYGNEE